MGGFSLYAMGKRNNQRDRQRKKTIQRKKEAKPTRVKDIAAPNNAVRTQQPANVRTTKYLSTHRTLVVGDGDFSFSRGLVRHRGGGAGLLATAFDSEKTVATKYKKFDECKRNIEASGAQLQFSVDATKLEKSLSDEGRWDRIVFNFPHSGKQRVHVNRVLLHDFFESATKQLNPGGEIHVTLKDKPPYSGWNIEQQAAPHGLVVREKLPFHSKEFPGYRHCTTLANDAETQFEAFEKHCRVWHFGRAEDPYVSTKSTSNKQSGQKRKRQEKNTQADEGSAAKSEPMVEPKSEPKKPKFVIEFD